MAPRGFSVSQTGIGAGASSTNISMDGTGPRISSMGQPPMANNSPSTSAGGGVSGNSGLLGAALRADVPGAPQSLQSLIAGVRKDRSSFMERVGLGRSLIICVRSGCCSTRLDRYG